MVKKRKIIAYTALMVVMLMSSSGTALGQLLFKPEMEIENYARTGYNLYGRTQISRSSNPRYDEFGNYIMSGVSIFKWDEQKINSKHQNHGETYSEIDKMNPVDENEFFHFYLDDLVVLSESNVNFSSRFIVGNEIRVKFSPLTVDMNALNGIRWDFNFANNDMTLIASRADLPLWFSLDSANIYSKQRLLPVYLTGAHIERKFGIFNVAANYVNTYKTDSSQSRGANSITGTIAHDYHLPKPQQLVVKVEDGSRFDAGGPKVYEIFPVVNGVKRPELMIGVSRGNWKEDIALVRQKNNPNYELYTTRYFIEPMRVPDFYEFNNLDKATPIEEQSENILARRYNTDPNVTPMIDFKSIRGNDAGNPYLECNGEDYLLFWFQIPQDEDISEVKFKALVSNNYIISCSEVYENVQSDFNTAALGQVNATYFDAVLYSKGDVKDDSNLGWVEFEHGNATANMLMSFRLDTQIKGFKLVTEYSRNMKFRQYSSNKAKKFRDDAEAYYINLQKEFGDFSLGAEYFKLDPDYSTNFKNVDRTYQDIGQSWSEWFTSDPTQRGNSFASSQPQEFMNLTEVIDTVDDNDDKDRYPDWHIYGGVRDTNGIFPGLDKNGNNRPDTNENDNLIPDYVEPFFLYDVDPDEYDYGFDLNNNSTIDVRENDDKPDYPYDLNRKGYHVFGSYGGEIGWKGTLGFVNFHKIAGGGETDVRYGSVEYNKFIPFFANVRFATMTKKVKDSIQDDIFKVARQLSTTLIDSTTYAYNMYDDAANKIFIDIMTEKYYDPLRYRDSWVNKTYFETNLFRIPNLTIGMKLKYDINHQNETSEQNKNDIIDRTQIYRADYKYYLGKLLIQPQVKFLNRKYTNGDGYERIFHEQYFYPILKMEYPLTLNTTFRAGAQGMPGLHATVRNLMNDQLDYDTKNYVLMFSNKSFYSGYDFSLNFGFKNTWQQYNGFARQAYNRTEKVYFVRLIVGLEPIS